MRKTLAIAGLAAAGLLGLTGCGGAGTPAAAGGAATTAGAGQSSPAQPPATSAAATTEPTTEPASTTEPPARTETVVGPAGFGPLRLGMGKSAAEATGAITPFRQRDGAAGEACPSAAVLNTPDTSVVAVVLLSTKLGVATIEVPTGMHTPEGIGRGSTLAAAKQAYPDLKSYTGTTARTGRNSAKVPGNAAASYRVVISGGKVSELTLQLSNQDCYE
jgi:hypothetical protein